jgi:acetylornithine deacetylase/succinyl-diaminopimelate desuccinylase-like protein
VARLSERPTPFLLPYWTDPRSRVARVLGGAVRAVTGRAPVWTAGRSVADENVVGAMGIPTVVHGPLGGGDHTRGEWVDAASLGAVRDVLVRALEAWEPP